MFQKMIMKMKQHAAAEDRVYRQLSEHVSWRLSQNTVAAGIDEAMTSICQYDQGNRIHQSRL